VALVLRRAALEAWLPTSAAGARAGAAAVLPVKSVLFSCAALAAPVRKLLLEPDPSRLSWAWLVAGVVSTSILWIAAWRVGHAARPALRRCAWAGALALLPVMNLLPQETILSERFLYLASGFWLLPAGVLVVTGWRRSGPLRPVVAGAAALALVLLAGISAWRARAWRDDVILWRIATREEPNRAAFWDRLGLALTEKSDFGSAEQALRRATALDPQYFNALFNLGGLMQSTRRPRQALEAYRKAAAIDPNHVTLHLNIGISLREMGDIRGAYAEFERAVALKPDSPEALRMAGGCALQMGKLADARRYLEEARRLLPGHPAIEQAYRVLEEKEHLRQQSADPKP
jgi:tetratricopeptide (TPR) repeat protein